MAESNPNTLKVQPAWAKSIGGEVIAVADKIKITDSGEKILSGTSEFNKLIIFSICNSSSLHYNHFLKQQIPNKKEKGAISSTS